MALATKTDVNNAINTNLKPLIAYPIGSVYFSVNNTNPANILGGGTWTLIGNKLAVRENVIGNGFGLALSDGSGDVAFHFNYNGGAFASYSDHVGRRTGAQANGEENRLGKDAIIGLATKNQLGAHPEYSGLIVDTEPIYSWKRTA